MRFLEKIIEIMLRKIHVYNYHKIHKNQAMRILESIEREKGKTNPKYIRFCKEYAKDIFGNEKYAPWLFVYTAMAGEFKEGWIPDNYYGQVVLPKLKGDYSRIGDRNLITDSLLQTAYPLNIGYYVNNLFLTKDYKVLNDDEIVEFLFKKNENIVYKVENSFQGRGIYFFNKENFRIADIKKLGTGVFQNYIKQHSFFSEFTELSVATIRLTSVCDDRGNIIVKAAYLRIGRDNDTHVKSSSAVKVPINIGNGELSKYGYFPDWTSTESHPNSKTPFANKIIPSFKDCISEVIRMHSRVPFVRCIGWDIIVDRLNNIRLIEWNGRHNDIKFSEATQGPCFKEFSWEKLK